LLLLLGGVLPRRQGRGMGAAVGFIGSSCEVFETGASHSSIMSEGRDDVRRAASA
jgi:hypothetical protein